MKVLGMLILFFSSSLFAMNPTEAEGVLKRYGAMSRGKSSPEIKALVFQAKHVLRSSGNKSVDKSNGRCCEFDTECISQSNSYCSKPRGDKHCTNLSKDCD